MRNVTWTVLLLWAGSLAQATPWFTQDPRTLPEGKWRVEEHGLYSATDSALTDGHDTPLPAGEFTTFVAHTRVRYGVADDLTVFADLPWVSKRLTRPDGTVATNDGLGDIFLLAKYKYAESKAQRTRRAWALGYKTHTGDFHGLAGPLATGSGTTDLTFLHLWEQGRGATTWYGNLGYAHTGRRADTGRDPGNALLFNLAADQRLRGGGWTLVGELNGRYEGNTTAGRSVVAGTGSLVLSVAPGLQYTRPGKAGRFTTFEAGVQLPVVTEGDAPALADYTVYFGGYTVF